MTALPSPRTRQRDETREKVLDAALELIVTRGYEATSIDDIAKAASLTKGAVYFHFHSKAGVLLALLDRVEQTVVDPVDRRVRAAGPSARDKFVVFTHQQSELGRSQTMLAILAIQTSSAFARVEGPFQERIMGIYRRLYAIIEDIVTLGQARKEFRGDINPRQIASYIIAAHDGTFLEWHRRGLELRPPEIVHAFRLLMLGALRMAE
ncbi:MAG: TetR/AcrR family transcriptional regulator [Alphaproteobacteria bacterium]